MTSKTCNGFSSVLTRNFHCLQTSRKILFFSTFPQCFLTPIFMIIFSDNDLIGDQKFFLVFNRYSWWPFSFFCGIVCNYLAVKLVLLVIKLEFSFSIFLLVIWNYLVIKIELIFCRFYTSHMFLVSVTRN